MAVYEGARAGSLLGPYPVAIPAPESVRRLPRRRLRPAVRAGRATLPVGIVLGAIVVVFMIGFFSLAQAVRVSASNYEVDRLSTQQERLQARERELQSDISRLGSEPAIRKLAFDAGLGQLDQPIVLPAR